MEVPQENLLERAVHGDEEALAALLKRHGPAARWAIVGRIPKRWRALIAEDDLLQQTYADAVSRIGQFDSANESGFAAWLAAIARNNVNDAVKLLGAEKRGGKAFRMELPTGDGSLKGTGTTPSSAAGRGERARLLRGAIEQLPEIYACAVELYWLQEKPIEEVAEAIGRSRGAAYMVLARARERLHETLGPTSDFFSR
jgi:RNA polymerase sigma factor (sigma-70 family)